MDYPVYGRRVAESIADGANELGVLICGTGIGMSLTANKVPGIRAAVCSEPFSARMARAHNDAQIITFGARVVGESMAVEIVDAFINAKFEGGRHAKRVMMIEGSAE
jgi:ribose 5-phosphate isomerase B